MKMTKRGQIGVVYKYKLRKKRDKKVEKKAFYGI